MCREAYSIYIIRLITNQSEGENPNQSQALSRQTARYYSRLHNNPHSSQMNYDLPDECYHLNPSSDSPFMLYLYNCLYDDLWQTKQTTEW
jgi:hypothetical protein